MSGIAAPGIVLGGRAVGGGQPVFVVCEAGVTNYGDPDLARRQIDAAVAARADAVKFQLWRTEDLVSPVVARRLEPALGYDWFDRLKSKELPVGAMADLKRYAEARGILFTATPHDEGSLDVLDRELDVPFLKVGSGEAHNLPFLAEVARRRRPVVISFGFQTDQEILAAVGTLRDEGASGIAVMHCVTAYPTPYPVADLPRIAHLRRLTGCVAGYSDHTVGRHAVLAAVACGASIVEKHLTFDKADPRSLDNAGALLPEEFATLVAEIRDLERALVSPDAGTRRAVADGAREWAGQSIVAARDLRAGARLDRGMVALKRPARGGIGPDALPAIVGATLRRAIARDEQIQFADLDLGA